MLFNSVDFLLFFPAVCMCYYLIPYRIRHVFLLGCSYYFYMCWNAKYALLMLTSTIITYMSGLLIDSANRICDEKKQIFVKNTYVALSFISNLSILFFFKYFNFAAATVVNVFRLMHIELAQPTFDVILPVGISFYTFQALSYTMDVYRKEIYAERNFLKYALFVSFFPQLVAGPIERSKNLLIQINKKHDFDFEGVKKGFLLMLYGFFQKVVLSEYLSMVVDNVFDNYRKATGFQLIVASVCFAFQIYCDFAGYSSIAIGAAKVMGFNLMENFNTPYFSKSVAEFWRRWHISLSSWFRDYLYIPLGGNRKGKIRKYFNLMVVFLASGLWHGANWHFVIWGGLNGAFQIIGEITAPIRKKCIEIFHINTEVFSHKLLQMILTFTLVDFTWIFFRASTRQSIVIILKILGLRGDKYITWGRNLKFMGLTLATRNVLVVSLAILLLFDIAKYNKIDIFDWILKQGLWLRCLIYYIAIFGILIFGVYGSAYDASQFIYFQF